MVPRTIVVVMSASLLAGCSAARSSSSPTTSAASTSVAVQVSLEAAGCAPVDLRTGPGLTTLRITNHGTAAGTFTVLSGDHVVGLLRGVPVGAAATLVLDLDKGVYRTDCHTATEGGGRLLVGVPSDVTSLGQPADLLAATTNYRAYLRGQTSVLLADVRQLRSALAGGDLTGARAAYLRARLVYGHVKAAAANFDDALLPGLVDLDAVIDPPPDGATGGFPRIASALWGGASTGVVPATDALIAEAASLQSRLAGIHLDAVSIAEGQVSTLGEVVDGALTGHAEPASHLDLVDAQGALEGAQAAIGALREPLRRRDPNLETRVVARLATVATLLATLRAAGGYPVTGAVAPAVLRRLADDVDAAADALSAVPGVLARPTGP